MKWLAGVLVLLNIALFGYFNRQVVMPDRKVVSPAINPEKLKILTQAELESLPKRAPEAPQAAALPQVAAKCYVWGPFVESNLPAAQVVLARLDLPSTLSQESAAEEDRRYWVFYPPLKTAEQANKKANEIKALGVSELYIIQDSQWRNAISFGLFQDEHLATNLLKELHQKGVKNAAKMLRSTGKNVYGLMLENVGQEVLDELKTIAPEFVGSSIEESACEAVPATPGQPSGSDSTTSSQVVVSPT